MPITIKMDQSQVLLTQDLNSLDRSDGQGIEFIPHIIE